MSILLDTNVIVRSAQPNHAQHDVKGKAAHDARLIAAMKVHGLSTILTFNKAHFTRYTSVVVFSPNDVVQPTS